MKIKKTLRVAKPSEKATTPPTMEEMVIEQFAPVLAQYGIPVDQARAVVGTGVRELKHAIEEPKRIARETTRVQKQALELHGREVSALERIAASLERFEKLAAQTAK